jgi:hypothetical protein
MLGQNDSAAREPGLDLERCSAAAHTAPGGRHVTGCSARTADGIDRGARAGRLFSIEAGRPG